MHDIVGLFSNTTLLAAITGWFVAQALKIPTYFIVEKKWDFRRFFGAGGMPSSHTAMVVALMISVGVIDGFNTPEFALSFVFDGPSGRCHQ